MSRKKGSGGGFSISLSISISPMQRKFLLRKEKETAASAAGYLRLLLDRDMAKEQEAGMKKEAQE